MTTLNRRLQLAILNRKKGRNALEQGFTLVELMIVIVIVGILSAVALPNFLGQTTKAKATECTSKGGAIMSQVAGEALLSKTQADTLLTTLIGKENATPATGGSEICTFAVGGTRSSATDPVYKLTVVGKSGSELAGKYSARFCVNADTGRKKQATNETGTPPADAAPTICS